MGTFSSNVVKLQTKKTTPKDDYYEQMTLWKRNFS